MISQNSIQQILGRLDIVEVIGGFVKLKKRGSNWLGLCPFHNEKTPSFSVSPSKEIYKCFGCGRSGNTISFLMEHEKYSYVEALRWLAILPILKVVHFFLSDALAGAGYQGLKASIHVGVALFNVLINLWIIPAYSWRGAAWSSIASDALLACGIGAAVLILSRRSQTASAEAAVAMRAEA